MYRSTFSVGLGLSVAALLALSLGGCPGGGIFGGGGGTTGTLSVSGQASGAATTDKPVTLTATASNGTEPYTFEWSQVGGPAVTLTTPTAAQAGFTPTVGGIYKFNVRAVDSKSAFGVTEVDVPVGDLQFVVPATSSVIISGNPALILRNIREGLADVEARASVFDPQYTDDQNTQMTVKYDLISVPTGATTDNVSLDRDFDTISNQGTGDADFSSGVNVPSLDAGVRILFRPNPNLPFKVLTNIGSTLEDFGAFVTGDYTFRATVTNPDGVQRTRDLIITLQTQDFSGSTGFSGSAAGPQTIAVEQLPAGSPGKVTDKVMTASQTATMTVVVLPTTRTNYRFYLVDNNGVAHMDFVASSVSTVDPAATPTEITLTIGKSGGLPTATYTLFYESFDNLGQLGFNQVLVNGTVPVRFHVTKDFLKDTTVNTVLVGAASNVPASPTGYEGWTGDPVAGAYGPVSALADVNLDGAPDIITLNGGIVAINTRGFVDGSAAALTHPVNSGNFGPQLPFPDHLVNPAFAAATQMAVGDLNGDGLPDIAINDVIGGTLGVVRIFFHTGDPAQPYSAADDQMLTIAAPTYERVFRNATGDITTIPAGAFSPVPVPGRALFGMRLAIAPVVGNDTQADLIITDPGFNTMRIYNTPGPRPAALTNFYAGAEGRVYVFAGGSSGALAPGRPDMVASEIKETGVTDAVPTPSTVEFVETNAKFAAVYAGNEFDIIGLSLAATNSLAVGSPLALATSHPSATYTLTSTNTPRVTDAALVTTTIGGVAQTYEFDRDSPGNITAGHVRVDISATDADLPAAALTALLAAINGDTDRVVDAIVDPANPEGLILTSVFTAEDQAVRGGGSVVATVGTGSAFAQIADGIVYTVAANTASGALATAIDGTANSGMGLGTAVALGNINGTGATDLVIAARDSGAGLGVNGDGAVFVLLDGTTTLPAAVAGVGLNTGDAATPSTIGQTLVGAVIGVGDVNGDGLAEVFFTEPGFDRIYMIKGAATPATTPDMTFTGVTFADLTGTPPNGSSLANTGTFLFGDINGDTHADWLFLDSGVNFGFAGISR